MKTITTAIVLIFSMISSFPAKAENRPAFEQSKPCNSDFIRKLIPKDGDPFPWFLPLEIPWAGIEGVWKAKGDVSLYLDIKVMGINEKGARYVQVQVFSNLSQTPIAKGIGFVPKKERILEAIVTGSKINGRIRIASIAFPTMGCSKFRAETAAEVNLFDKSGKSLVDEVMFMKKVSGTQL